MLDRKLIAEAMPALESGTPVKIEATIHNTDRSAGAMLSGEVAKRYGNDGLPDDTIAITLTRHGRPELRRLPGRAASRST